MNEIKPGATLTLLFWQTQAQSNCHLNNYRWRNCRYVQMLIYPTHPCSSACVGAAVCADAEAETWDTALRVGVSEVERTRLALVALIPVDIILREHIIESC